jgi:hypothetical protein
MRGTVAKRLLKAIYGEDFSPRERQYVRGDGRNGRKNTGRRAAYQQLKKAVHHGR